MARGLQKQQSQAKNAGEKEKTPEQRAADRKAAEKNMTAYSCSICKQTFANTATPAQLTEHKDSKHPKEEVIKLFTNYTECVAKFELKTKKAAAANAPSGGGGGGGGGGGEGGGSKKADAKAKAALAAAALAKAQGGGKAAPKKKKEEAAPAAEEAANKPTPSTEEVTAEAETKEEPMDVSEPAAEEEAAAAATPADIPQRIETEESKALREKWQAKAKAEHAKLAEAEAAQRAEAEAAEAKAALAEMTGGIEAGIKKGEIKLASDEFAALLVAAGMA